MAGAPVEISHWRASVHDLVADCAEKWRLRLGAAYEPGAAGHVLRAELPDGTAAVLKLNEDKEHAEEAARTIGFVPEWIAGPDTNKEVRSAISISPDMRAFIADYIRRAVK